MPLSGEVGTSTRLTPCVKEVEGRLGLLPSLASELFAFQAGLFSFYFFWNMCNWLCKWLKDFFPTGMYTLGGVRGSPALFTVPSFRCTVGAELGNGCYQITAFC